MADVASTLRSWSSTASSNQPSGTTTIGSGLDDNLRQIQATVRQFLADQSATVVPSAGVADLTTATGRWVPVSGSSTVTGFGTESAGVWYLVTLTGSPTINNGNISTPGAATIAGSAGDMFVADSQGGGVWRIWGYTSAKQSPVRAASKAWVKFAGATGTVASSYNVSSVTRNSTGTYSVSFATSFASADYVAVGNQQGNSRGVVAISSPLAGSCTITTADGNTGALEDRTSVYVVFFGDQ